jgi:hypothetical protein
VLQNLDMRVRIQSALAGMSTALCVLTLAYPEWIEALTGLEPDAGSGALELLVSAVFLLVAIGLLLLNRRDRRLLPRPSLPPRA